MAAKHFRANESLGQHDNDEASYRPRHGSFEPQSEGKGQSDGQPSTRAQAEGQGFAQKTARTDTGHVAASHPSVRGGGGTGWYYGEPQPSAAQHPSSGGGRQSDGSRASKASATSASPNSSRRRGRVIAVCAGAVCVAAVVVGLGVWASSRGSGGAPNANQAASQQVEQQADANAAAPSADASPEQQSAPDSQSEQTGAASQASTANDVVSKISSLSHGGADCSLPTDGVEVDVRDGWVLVAYQSAEDAQGTLSRMTSSAAALAQGLAGTQLSDSSTAQNGVSTVPATSAPAAIAASDASTPFAGVQVVALGEGRYVIGSVTLASADGLDGAGETQILSAASSYAIEGPAYRYSGLASRNVAQSKGNAPTLLTGEKIVMRMTVPQPAQTQSTSSNAKATGTSSTNAGRSGGSTSSSTSASRSSASGTSSARSTSTGTSARRSTTYSGGGSGYSSGSGYGTSGSGTGGSGSGSGSIASGYAASGSASATQGDAAQ